MCDLIWLLLFPMLYLLFKCKIMRDTISSTFILLLALTIIAAFLALNVSTEIMATTVVFWL